MAKMRVFPLALILLANMILNAGCWNYREVDNMAVVAGVAVDKGTSGRYKITVEIVKISGGRDTKKNSELISMEGNTMMDTVRNGISVTGKKLYWSHSKVVILSRDIVAEGIEKTIDWYMRDAETREDVHLLVSEAASAREIFEGQVTTEDIKSFILDNMLDNEVNLSKAPITDVLKYRIETKIKGISAVIPIVKLKKADNKVAPQIVGSGIIKNGKEVGILNGEETQTLLFIRDEVKGGILLEGIQEDAVSIPVSLEIFNSRTKIEPVINGKSIEINLKVDTTVAIDEIEGSANYIDEDGRKQLEQAAANSLKKRIVSLVGKVQSEYDADIFRFGTTLWEDKPGAWKSMEDDWEEIFRDLKVNVESKIHIKNSAILSKTLEKGD